MKNSGKESWDLLFLTEAFQELIEKFQPKQRFIHPKTTANFIFYFNTFKDKRVKQHIYENLFQMMESLQEVSIEDLTAKFGAFLYDTYIQPLINYYNVRQRFFIHVNWKYLVSLQIVVFLFLFLLKVSSFKSLIILLLFISFYLYEEKKRKQRRLYGVFF